MKRDSYPDMMLGMQRKPKHSPISKTLRDAIIASNESVFRIAQKTGVDHRAMARFLEGKHVTTATADKLAEYMELVLVHKDQLK